MAERPVSVVAERQLVLTLHYILSVKEGVIIVTHRTAWLEVEAVGVVAEGITKQS